MLADKHGNVVVVGTRDCSLQRRNQKLVEEAPAPFLTDEQRARIHESAKAICREAGYHGAGTVEFLVGSDGVISFLEVNTRLQVEHPVTEETTGIDLVREQFRIADGEKLRFTRPRRRAGTPSSSASTARTPGRGFLPAPGHRHHLPRAGRARRARRLRHRGQSVIGGAFDSLLAKLIVTGATRDEALARSRRALDEFVVDGMATALPFHRAVVRDQAFTAEPFTIFTRWIETEFDNEIPPFSGGAEADDEAGPRETVVVEVGGKRLEVSLPAGFGAGGGGGGEEGGAEALGGQEGRCGRRPATRSPRRCRARSSRSRSPRATSSSRPDDRRPRGDEDGAAAQRPQGRHDHRAQRRGRCGGHLGLRRSAR